MLVLVVDSSTPAVTAAIADIGTAPAGAVLAERVTVDPRAHGELLAPAIAAVLAEVDARPADLAAVVAGLGPGPFTGLRVGLVTAAAMGHALGIPCYGVGSLDALGHAALDDAALGDAALGDAALGPSADGHLTLVATDARRRELYWAVYDGSGARLVGPAVAVPAEVAARAAELGVRTAVGDGALRYADVLGLPVATEPRYPPARALAALAAERVRAGAPAEPLSPLYLRRPDAVAPTARKPALPS